MSKGKEFEGQYFDRLELLQINLLLSKAARNRKPFLNCGFFNIDLSLRTLLSRQLQRTWSSLRNLRRTLMSMHNFLNSANELHILKHLEARISSHSRDGCERL